MLRLIFPGVILLATLTLGFSQMDVGVKLGFHHGEVREVYEPSTLDFSVGGQPASLFRQPELGVWWSVPFSSQWGLQTELLWVHKVWRFNEQLRELEGMAFDYLSLPIAATYRWNNWQLTLGPTVDFLLDQRFFNPIRGLHDEESFSDDFTLEVGVNLGVQYRWQEWIFGLRAYRAITALAAPLFTDINGEPAQTGAYYHQGLTLWAGYQLWTN